jgi:hypothetical protein
MAAPINDPDAVPRLLQTLKKHEQPPPQFFSDFSSRVMDHLDAPERPETMNWLQRMGVRTDVSPAVIGGVAFMVCGMLFIGYDAAWKMHQRKKAAGGVAQSFSLTNAVPLWLQQPGPEPIVGVRPLDSSKPAVSSTAPVLTTLPTATPFDAQAGKAGFNTGPSE